jgi:hypothetical protein
MRQYGKVVRLECSWALWKEQNEAFPTVPPSGQTDKWKALKPRVKAENVPKYFNGQNINGHNAVRKAHGNPGGK